MHFYEQMIYVSVDVLMTYFLMDSMDHFPLYLPNLHVLVLLLNNPEALQQLILLPFSAYD